MTKFHGWALAAAVGLHLILGFLYANATPYRTAGILLNQGRSPTTEIGAPDERQHANYIQHLIDGKGIPRLVVNVPDPDRPGQTTRNPALAEEYEAHQPPLYYAVAAGWAKVFGVQSVEDPSARSLRYLNLLLGGATVAGVFFFCLWGGFGPAAALVAAILAALLPMNLALSGAISNDPMLIAISTGVLALCARGLVSGWSIRLSLLAGSLVGLGILTKTSALPLFLVLLLAIHLGPKSAPSWRIWAVAVGSSLCLAVPWWLRNVGLYQPQGYGFDFLGMNAFRDAFADNTKGMEGLIAAFGPFSYWVDWVAWWTVRSFVGVFGSMDIFLTSRGSAYDPSQATYRILLALFLLAAVGWILQSMRSTWAANRVVHRIGIAFLVVNVLLLARFNMIYFQGQGRYLYPAIAVIAGGLAVGTLYWLKDRWALAAGLIGSVLLAMNLYIVLSVLPQEFARRMG